ncbi:MAG: hypothetical protein LHW59_08225 [Candidatus Cloacimonetes bacterium]|nr:hypothetical protein [Candidatus Cloacimonadota bacterium]
MKMKMKMKNNKMFLALVVVAALAMVSVAGVAVLSDDSSAAAEVTSGSVYTVQSDTQSIDIEIHVVNSAVTEIVIPSTMTYTGTISVGAFEESVFTAVGSANLKGVSNVTVYVSVDGSYVLKQASATSVSGTTELTMGSISTANSAVVDSAYYGYNGTIICNGATIVSANVYGLIVTAQNSEAVLSNLVTSATGNEPTDWTSADAYYATLTVSGTAYIGNLVIGSGVSDYVEMIVADGAKVYSMNDVRTVTVTTTTAMEASGYAYAIATGSSTAVVGTYAPGSNTIEFTLDTSSVYNVYTYSGITDGKYTYGTIDFSVSGIYTVNATTGTLVTPAITVGNYTVATDKTIAVSVSSPDNYTVTGFIVLTDGTVVNAAVSVLANVATLTFTSSEFAVSTSYSAVILTQKTGSVLPAENLIFVSKITTPAASGGSVSVVYSAMDGTMSAASNTIVFSVSSDSKLLVNGSIKFTQPYTSIRSMIIIDSTAKVNFGTNGIISVDNTAITSTQNVNATYYKTGSTAPYTYNYTTLDNALAASADVTIYGKLVILTDKTLASTLTGATTTKVAVDSYATVSIGNADTFVNVTVPSTTTLTTGASNCVIVVYGKLIFEEKSTAPSCNAGVQASVGMKEGTSYTYTDLATALGVATSGDTVTLRGNASISTDAVIASGVTVTTGSNTIMINAGGSLTVTGTLNMGADITVSAATTGTSAKAAGQLVINKMPVYTAGKVVLNGILTISSSVGTSTTPVALVFVITSTEGTAASPAILNIAGIISDSACTIGSNGFYMTINVTGEIASSFSMFPTGTNNKITMNVTGEFNYGAAEYLYNLNVTGTGIVESVSSNVLKITGKAVIGTPAKTSAVKTDAVAVEFVMVDGSSAMVYGSPATGKVVISSETADHLYMAILNVNSTTVYGTAYMAAATAGNVAVAVPEITGTTFMGWYTNPSFIANVYVSSVPASLVGESYYMKLTELTYNLILTYNVGVTYVLDGANVGSSYNGYISYGEHTLTAQAASGYKGTVTITMTGATLSSGKFTATQDVSATSTGVSEDVVSGGWTITDILLVIMVIIIAVIAVVVILKLMRS